MLLVTFNVILPEAAWKSVVVLLQTLNTEVIFLLVSP